jgi:transcriptional regulator with XRE-family HTH domain
MIVWQAISAEIEVEMQVNSQLIRSEREKRAWSQSHLASVTGLGMRTVQRIEATGSASYESVAAIASVFSMTAGELRAATAPESSARLETKSYEGGGQSSGLIGWFPRAKTIVRLTAAMAVSLLMILGALSFRAATAQPLNVDFRVLLDGTEPFMGGSLPGKGGFGRDDLVVKVKSRVLDDGSIILRARIYECEGDRHDNDLRLLSDSEVTTRAGSTAEIRFSSVVSGRDYTLRFTPHPA